MTTYKSEFVNSLVDRGYLYQCTDIEALDKKAAEGGLVGYIGFDCTAPSLHVGSLVQIMMLRRLQKAGGRPIVLIGGGTTKIGDPSFKDKARPVLTEETIEYNKTWIKKNFSAFLDFDGPNAAIMLDNAQWLDGLGYMEFLRDYGPHFTINRMINLESVRLRLDREQPLTFLEFNYMLLQAYDFLELAKRENCALQLGGSDQWGNIVNGVDLTRRVAGKEVYGFTTPLITTASGGKMGKTVDGAVWLNADPEAGEGFYRSAYDYWQFWRNTDDADVGKFLRLFTDLPLDDVAKLESLKGAEINDAKKRLAFEATAMLHGAEAAKAAEDTARKVFEEGSGVSGLPTTEISSSALAEGYEVLEGFMAAGLCASKGEGRRHIKGNALKVNDEPVTDPFAKLSGADVNDGVIKLSVGKKRHALLKPV